MPKLSKLTDLNLIKVNALFLKLFDDISEIDRATIQDFFIFLVLDLLKETKDIENYVKLLESYSEVSQVKNSEFYSGFFFVLSQILSLEFSIKMLKAEELDRESFEKEFENLLKEM